MNIGIDFDNTIVKYDNLFKEVAIREGFIKENWNGNGKTVLRNYLRRQPDGETTWMKLQGLVYGKYMHGAEIMPGVANFVFSCKVRNHKIYIVSHKTEYGHFDPEMISLRGEALKWMDTNRFFDPEYFGINNEDVFFADTREEKVNIIDRLNCVWFIDDLSEVFDEKHFPASTKKILFGTHDSDQYQDRMILNSWRKISEQTMGQITNQDVICWVKDILNHSLEHVEKIPGRGNSSIYKIHVSSEKSYALKYYPDLLHDTRPRLKIEFQALEMLHDNGVENVPQPIEKNYDLNIGLYKWINGKNIGKLSVSDLDQSLVFIEKLYNLSKQNNGNDIGTASEACLSAHELGSQINNRYLRLGAQSNKNMELSVFLEEVFDPLWKKVKGESISLWPEESRENKLPREKQVLSPSDFGFHNCVKANDGSITFLDFDYFGWDDPVKLTADFIWHPGMDLNIELKQKWKAAMMKLFSDDPYFEERLNASMPLYGMRWALIVLNEFFPELAQKRKNADGSKPYDLKKRQKIQLQKAKRYCIQVKNMVLQNLFV